MTFPKALLVLGLAMACGVSHAAAPDAPRAPLTSADHTENAFSRPLPGLTAEERARFFVGNSYFNQNWLSAPASVASRDGLGPLFNARSCSGCHFKDGRGAPPAKGEPLRTMLVRISTPERDESRAPTPDPRYGDQLQGSAVSGAKREADIFVRYRDVAGTYADGKPYSLRAPTLELRELGYGPVAPGLQTSARVAPTMIGLGLLAAVPDEVLLAHADPDDRDRDGISGRPNRVPSSARGQRMLGRFGWKAETATLTDQVAAAFLGDMGITSRLFGRENHSALQPECGALPSGGSPELRDDVLDAVVAYAGTLAVPAPRANDRRGEALFEQAQCARCHVPTLTTSPSATPATLAARAFHPYTDLLLHDLGPALSDERPTFAAEGSEWRTAPLWGLGLVARVNGHTTLLHDGRARDVSEAILWHGGEAQVAQRAFVHMNERDRQALVAFVESL